MTSLPSLQLFISGRSIACSIVWIIGSILIETKKQKMFHLSTVIASRTGSAVYCLLALTSADTPEHIFSPK